MDIDNEREDKIEEEKKESPPAEPAGWTSEPAGNDDPGVPKSENVSSETEEPSSANAPKPKKRGRQRLSYPRRLMLLVCIAVFVFAGYNLVLSLLEYKEGDDAYNDIANEFLSTPAPDSSATPTAVPTPTLPLTSDDVPPADSDEPTTSFVEDFAPDAWPDVDFDGLLKKNADTEAWIIGVGTNINYPVVHSLDNADYLNHMFDGRASKLGAIFIDARNRREFVDRNTIIYGHNMRNHSMFWTLTQYKNKSFYQNHPTFRLIRPDGRYEIQLFAGTVADANEYEIWKLRFSNDEEFTEWVQMLRDRSKFASSVEVGPEDRVVSLSTCSYEFTGARFVVFGKLVPLDGQVMPPIYSASSSGETPAVTWDPPVTPDGDGTAADNGTNNTDATPTPATDVNGEETVAPADETAAEPSEELTAEPPEELTAEPTPEPTGSDIVNDALGSAFDRIKNRGG